MSLFDQARRGFQVGERDGSEVLDAEQALAGTNAEVQQLELLIQMYQSIGTDPASPEPAPNAASSQTDARVDQ